MPKKSLIRTLTPAFVAVAALVVAPCAAFASAEHPKLIVGGEEFKPSHAKTAGVDFGQIQLKNRALGSLECVNLVFGTNFNNTEPGRTGEGTESIRAYGEVMGWIGNSFANASGVEAEPHCKSSTGFVAWATAEPRPSVTAEETTDINGSATERLVIAGPFGGTASHREPADLPWIGESVGTENPETKAKTFWLKTGVPVSATERSEVEAQEAAAGVPVEKRSGCYHQPLFTELTRSPGFTSTKETELALKVGGKGCINVNIVAPEVGVEIPFTGTLEPESKNGAKNALTPSSGEFKGGFIGETTEASSERNERELESAFGPGFTKSITPIKEIGYLHSELLTLK
jgi:hypothetical protein